MGKCSPKELQRFKEYRRKTYSPSKRKARYVKEHYGITVSEYKAMLSEPCALCGGEATHLDHDHKTGKIRKALCLRCNTGLGKFGDDPDRLIAAAEYLRSHECRS